MTMADVASSHRTTPRTGSESYWEILKNGPLNTYSYGTNGLRAFSTNWQKADYTRRLYAAREEELQAAARKSKIAAAQGKVMDDWQASYDEAKTANEERYQDILKGYGDRYDTAISSLQGLGDAEKSALENAYRISGSQQQQSLVNSGLASTTIRPAVMQQNEKQKQTALSGVNERLQREKIGLQTGLSGDTLAFKERREDAYPDQSYYLELLKQAGYAA